MQTIKETLLLDYSNPKSSLHIKITERRSMKMKTLFITLVLSLLVLSVIPGVLAVNIGSGITPDIITEDFPPMVWMCDDRVVTDDNTEPGRLGTETLLERINNYAFEGESIHWTVLVMDKNGIDKVQDVFATVGTTQGAGNDIEVNCQRIGPDDGHGIPKSCNARILEEELTEFDEDVMQFYSCTLTVETADSMAGEHFITVEALDMDGLSGTMAENEYWYFNPIIALEIVGDLTFDDVRPGTDAYSSTLLVGNDADSDTGVLLDMFISGTDFYDSSSSGAKCSDDTNKLSLNAFRYFATNGAYSTTDDLGIDIPPDRGDRFADPEGYVNIGYGIGFNDPTPFYDGFEIVQQGLGPGGYYRGNLLAPGAEMALTFKLSLPEPCNGDFDTGSIWFWGEAI